MALWLSHPASLDHDTGDHPESTERILALESALAARDWLGWERVQAPAVDSEVLELAHTREYIAAIENAAQLASARGHRLALDADTLVSPGSFTAACHGTGGAVEMVRRLILGDEHRVGFSAARPPGHHASRKQAMGFCLFNHVAVAARYAVAVLGLQRIAIIDWDVHHGNGTQDIFWTSDEVLFCSIQQMPLWPGSGSAEEIGAGAGRGLTLNLPVAPGAGDTEFVEHMQGPISERVRDFAPQLLLVSAGFDAHAEDPLAACRVSEAGFSAMAAAVWALAEAGGVPLGLVLEGGYAVDALARSVVAVMETLSVD